MCAKANFRRHTMIIDLIIFPRSNRLLSSIYTMLWHLRFIAFSFLVARISAQYPTCDSLTQPGVQCVDPDLTQCCYSGTNPGAYARCIFSNQNRSWVEMSCHRGLVCFPFPGEYNGVYCDWRTVWNGEGIEGLELRVSSGNHVFGSQKSQIINVSISPSWIQSSRSSWSSTAWNWASCLRFRWMVGRRTRRFERRTRGVEWLWILSNKSIRGFQKLRNGGHRIAQ